MAKDLVLLFGTFNPVTNAHVGMGRAVRSLMPHADIVYIPCNGRFLHSWKNLDEQNTISDEVRVRLLADAVAPFGFSVDTLEVEGIVDGKTYHTAEYFKQRGKQVWICMGMDKVGEFHTWYRAEELLRENRFLICTRDNRHLEEEATDLVRKYFGNFREIPMEQNMQTVSATQIREAYLSGTLDSVREMMPENVYKFLKGQDDRPKENSGEKRRTRMSLKKSYEPYFKIGAAISAVDLSTPSRMELLKEEFSSFTCENDMKPMYFMDREENKKHPEKYERTPAMKTTQAIPFLEFAKASGIPMRGHTLVWHNQTPRWFFYQKYDENGELASRETMLARLDSYIHYVLDFVQTNYPGVIYAWDVVNEAVDEAKEEGEAPSQAAGKAEVRADFRQSLWLKTVGPDFIEKAFEYARKYAAPGVKLFYNDYETALEWKRDFILQEILVPLQKKGLLDGMGMQSHLLMEHPDMKNYETALHMYGALGIEVQITELDMHNDDPSKESMDRLAERYRELFVILTNAKKEGKANITSVTFWNLLDETSWLTGFRRAKSYPLLFGAVSGRKEAYYKVLEVAGGKEAAEAERDSRAQYYDEMAAAYEKEKEAGAREVFEFLKSCGTYDLNTSGEEKFPGPPAGGGQAPQPGKISSQTLALCGEKLSIRPDAVENLSEALERKRADIFATAADGKIGHISGKIVRDEATGKLYYEMVSAFFASPSMPPRVLSF